MGREVWEGKRERTNERTNDFFINADIGISKIPFFIQTSGKPNNKKQAIENNVTN